MSVALHSKDAQEKNVTYPTDGKLAIKMIHHLHRIAKEEKIQLRRTYVKEIKEHRIKLRFFRHPKKIKKARVAMKRLNLKKWMNHFLMILFLVKIVYFTYLLRHIRAEEREKYAKLYLMFYRLW